MDLVPVNRVLFDSGALHGSYIAKEWVDQRRDMLRPYPRRVIGMARMGDNQTLVPIFEMLHAEMVFTCTLKGDTTRGMVELAVMPMNDGMDAIIGLPDLLNRFLDLFVTMLENGVLPPSVRPELVEESTNYLSLNELKEKYPDVVDNKPQPPDPLELKNLKQRTHVASGPSTISQNRSTKCCKTTWVCSVHIAHLSGAVRSGS